MATHTFPGLTVMNILLALPHGVAAQAQEATAPTDQDRVPASSTEQGNTTIDESFDGHEREEQMGEQDRAASSATEFDFEFRTMYLDRNDVRMTPNTSGAITLMGTTPGAGPPAIPAFRSRTLTGPGRKPHFCAQPMSSAASRGWGPTHCG